jgi:hypothetical protein
VNASPKDAQKLPNSFRAEPPGALLAAYEATDYKVDTSSVESGTHLIRIGSQGGAGAAALLRALDARRAFIVTAWNPFSVRLQDDENSARQHRLVERLKERGYRWLPAKGVARDGDWPAEESLCVLDIEPQEVLELLDRFEQNAGVEVTETGARLVLHPSLTKAGA